MFLKSINLVNFRNYKNLELKFDVRPTIFIGNNGAGKSNILEAIYLLSTTKSQRVENEDELIKEGEEFAKVEGFINEFESGDFKRSFQAPLIENGGETELLVILNRVTEEVNLDRSTKRKKVLVNGISRRGVDFIGNLPAVIFYPSDINMVTGPPALRRWHLDLGLAQIDPQYKKVLTTYEHFLTARNRVLKRIREGAGRIDELNYWTDELVKMGKAVSEKRENFFNFINNLQTPLGEFKFEYKRSLPSSDDKGKSSDILNREIAAAQTLTGPHRDDYSVELEGRNMAHFGSRGEQRTATLAFKLAQLEYMAAHPASGGKILGQRPILLLDDVFSELDGDHRAHVVEIVGKQQTIIATVELENIPKEFLDSSRILKVEAGTIV